MILPDEEFINDLADVLIRMRRVFYRYDLSPPKAIELATMDDGTRLLSSLPKEIKRLDIEDPEFITSLVGIEIRFPKDRKSR